MAKLTCSRHNRRVQVINIGSDTNPVPLTVHRSGSKRNDVCDSVTVTIDGEYFRPLYLLEWNTPEYAEKFIQNKYDDLIYSSADNK